MVLSSLTHYSDRLRAGVEIVGIANFVTFLENTAPYRRDLRRAEYGDERDPTMRSTLEAISPIAHVGDIGVPLFVAHGANDPRVPVGEAEQIVHAVRESGHEVWYMLARNEGHGFLRKENRDVYTELAAMFLARHLGVELLAPPRDELVIERIMTPESLEPTEPGPIDPSEPIVSETPLTPPELASEPGEPTELEPTSPTHWSRGLGDPFGP